MKSKIIYSICLLLALATATARGQEIKVTEPICINDGTTLDVEMRIDANGLDVSCGGGYRLEISVENGDTCLILPEVLYLSRTRNLFEERKEVLAGVYSMIPYEVFNKVKRNKTYTTHYKISVPYSSWMENAKINYHWYQYGCGSDLIVADGSITAVKESELAMEEWTANPALYRTMVEFLTPEVERVKARTEVLRLNLEFPVNDYTVRASHSNNATELAKADKLMAEILDNELITVYSMRITGYASPEDRFTRNELLARNRAKAFEKYIKSKHNISDINIRTAWVAEDWDGLLNAIDTARHIPMKEQVKKTIKDNLHREPDTREWLVKNIGNRKPYDYLLKNIYPGLRRIELDVAYVVSNFTEMNARQYVFTRPELLNLNEIYMVALMYDEDCEDYKRVYRVATEQYPEDVIANNNMAAVMLRAGDTDGAYPYLQRIADDERSYVNIGVYYYIAGDTEKAIEYFTKAAANGVAKGEENLKLVTE